MSDKMILYDLPSKDPLETWSLNPWKTRMLLNYKTIPYETQWIEYPDIKPTFEKLIPPNETGMEYTIPTVRFPDGTYMQESLAIAHRIEKDYPNPNLHLHSETLQKVIDLLAKIHSVMAAVYIPKVPERLLTDASRPYFEETRYKRFGMSLEQLGREKGGDDTVAAGAPLLKQVTELLKKNNSGPYFDGNQITYVDFVWASYLKFLSRVGDDVLQRILNATGDKEAHLAQLKACDPWLARGDH